MKTSTMTGGRSMAAAFRAVAPSLKAPLGAASVKALRPMLAAAKRNVPVDEGDLKRSLVIKRDSKPRRATARSVIGPRADFVGKGGDKPVKYAHISEFGKADGSVKGTRWLTRAFEETKAEVLATFASEIGPQIEKAAARRAKRAAKQ